MTRKQIISGICLMLAVILIASGSYLFLYHFNNKYTRPSLQPANGLLVLSEEDLAAQPLTFLTSGWAYYPDVLLTPADFDNQTSNHYMIYTEIGQYSHFDLTEMISFLMEVPLMPCGFLCPQEQSAPWNCRKSSVPAMSI